MSRFETDSRPKIKKSTCSHMPVLPIYFPYRVFHPAHTHTLLLLNTAPSSSPSLPLLPPASGLGLWGEATKRNGSVEASDTAPTSQKTARGEPNSCEHACVQPGEGGPEAGIGAGGTSAACLSTQDGRGRQGAKDGRGGAWRGRGSQVAPRDLSIDLFHRMWTMGFHLNLNSNLPRRRAG